MYAYMCVCNYVCGIGMTAASSYVDIGLHLCAALWLRACVGMSCRQLVQQQEQIESSCTYTYTYTCIFLYVAAYEMQIKQRNYYYFFTFQLNLQGFELDLLHAKCNYLQQRTYLVTLLSWIALIRALSLLIPLPSGFASAHALLRTTFFAHYIYLALSSSFSRSNFCNILFLLLEKFTFLPSFISYSASANCYSPACWSCAVSKLFVWILPVTARCWSSAA